jgi:uncharacterized protein YhfF
MPGSSSHTLDNTLYERIIGEDDRLLAAWRDGHWRYFSRVLPKIGREPALDMPLVCERFRVLFNHDATCF